LWHRLGKEFSVHNQSWPAWNEELAAEDIIEIVVQVNGKVPGRVSLPAAADEATALSAARADANVAGQIEGKPIVKEIYVPGRLINFVVRQNVAAFTLLFCAFGSRTSADVSQ